MNETPRRADARAIAAGWPGLAEELEHWGAAGRVATLWWRDDDATTANPRLDRLLAAAPAVPIALAVIPGLADEGLAARLASIASPAITVLQHGWRHVDHSLGRRKSEFPPERSAAAVAADLSAGRVRLFELFGLLAMAVLAPPWNRFDTRHLSLLAGSGIGAISQIGPRRSAWPLPGLFAANAHVDLVAWAGDRGFVGETAALVALVDHLRGRRLGLCDAAEPTGIMTHHLVQDARAERFLDRLFAVTCAHPAARWLAPAEVFAPALAGST